MAHHLLDQDENTHAAGQVMVSGKEIYALHHPLLLDFGGIEGPEHAPPAGKGGGKNKNKSPDAIDDSATTDPDTDVTIDVLANDSDPDGDVLTVTSVSTASNGTVVLNGDGTVTYTPDSGFEGTDVFTYDVDDGQGGTATATVTVTVGNPAPEPTPEPTPDPGALPYYIQAVTFDDVNRWNYQDDPGTSVIVTYTFLTETPSYYHRSSTEYHKFTAFNAEQQDYTRAMLDMLETYANITFVETNDISQAQITYGFADLGPRYAGWAYIPDGDDGILDHSGDIWLNYLGPDLTPGTYYGMALLHETGHAVGLAHPFDGAITLSAGEDSRDYTVMAYNADPYSPTEPVTPMLYDIAALQYLYGANVTTNAGDTVYDLGNFFNVNYAIWDAGGIDTLDGVSLGADLLLDLNDGSFSNVGFTHSLTLAYDAFIENANGGSGNDTLIGNELDNVLFGGAGADNLFGDAGNDTLYFDAQDTLDGGAGIDTLAALFGDVIDLGSALLSSFENVDLTGGLADLVTLDIGDVLTLSDTDELFIFGDAGTDSVELTGGANAGTVNIGGADYTHYTDGLADLYVAAGVTVTELA